MRALLLDAWARSAVWACRREMYGARFEEKPFVLETVTMEQVIETKEEVYKG